MAQLNILNNNTSSKYADSSEETLRDLFIKPESQSVAEIAQILSNPTLSWPLRYHLSPQRHKLLDWYQYEEGSSLLEIGAGCGGITGHFLNSLKEVVCNELSYNRANVLLRRFADRENLTIYSGALDELHLERKFNYVTLIGVLEYAGKFSSESGNEQKEDPTLKMLNTARAFLKPDGHLIIAIENKIGLKYITGAPEDHYGLQFESLNQYPNYNGIETYSKAELTTILKNVGFEKVEFYYPFPDYKLPKAVFSEEGLKALDVMSLSSVLKTVDYAYGSNELFPESGFGSTLLKEGILDRFANSFIVDAS